MPLTDKGEKIMKAMQKQYGSKDKAQQVFYSAANKGTISGVHEGARDMSRQACLERFAQHMSRTHVSGHFRKSRVRKKSG